ncbi:MAG: uroporphyrinogen decarboxylase [Candidatus Adiutrix sp.]|jgi:hypothetical protein|nr:uroporphyrinogen decarboxylase [Candidatus Adiutrix sp.]
MTRTWQEKRRERFAKWLNPPGLEFVGPEAEKAYQGRVQRLIDAIELKKTPDRVPIYPNHTFLPAYVYGKTPLDCMSDVRLAVEIWGRFLEDYAFDAYGPIGLVTPIPPMETLGYELYKWPGVGGVPRTSIYRYVEHDWMEADEYADLARDPSNFWLRTYVPRFCRALAGFTSLPAATEFIELPNFASFVSAFGRPEVRASLEKLMEAGRQTLEWMEVVGQFMGQAAARGYPTSAGGFTKAPFDTLSDTLRSMQSAMTDMRRRPGPMLEALERLTPLAGRMAVDGIEQSGNPLVFIPLHKGADGFMSQSQFEKFYWPGLKKTMETIIEAGGVPVPFAEGGYNDRLDYFKDLPKGAVAWMIDKSDLPELKKRVGDHCCLIGNVPGSLFHSGEPADIEKYCRRLIDEVAPGGGFMMASGTVLDDTRPEMVKAMIDATLKYGAYC